MYCPHCGEDMIGDGFRMVLHCPNAGDADWWETEPDAKPIYCHPEDEDNE